MLLLRSADNKIGVIPPPAGVTPNFVDPPSLKHIVFITNSVFPFVSALFLAFRLYTTWFITRSPGLDDCKD